MARKHLKLDPHHISETAWWYEENAGITVVIECRNANSYHRTFQVSIPWRSLREAIKRKDKE